MGNLRSGCVCESCEAGGVATVEPEDGTTTIFETLVSDIQTGLAVTGKAITGTLKYIDTGAIAEAWGAGNFMALKFTPPTGATHENIKVGMWPSEGSGMVPLDADLNGVFKVTDKDAQDFRVETTINGVTIQRTYDLSGLVCEAE